MRVYGALLIANIRYWPTVASETNAELRRWRRRAEEIEDRSLHALAVSKLRSEHFNAQVATTLTTLVNRRLRPAAIEAIVALEVLFDHLDGVSEELGEDPLREAIEILSPLREAVKVAPPDTPSRTDPPDTPSRTDSPDTPLTTHRPRASVPATDDRGYVAELVQAVRDAIAPLPAISVVSRSLLAAAERCIEAQAHMHAAPSIGEEEVRAWATANAKDGPLHWREHLAGGASSVLAMHCLIVAAADERTTAAEAAALDELYLCIGVMSTTLDSVIDRERDLRAGAVNHTDRYESPEELSEALISVCERAVTLSAAVPHGAHHVMTLTGVLAYYLSSPLARNPYAEAVTDGLNRSLGPLLAAPTLMMKGWRLGKALSRHSRGARGGGFAGAHGGGTGGGAGGRDSDREVSAVERERREG